MLIWRAATAMNVLKGTVQQYVSIVHATACRALGMHSLRRVRPHFLLSGCKLSKTNKLGTSIHP